MAYISNKMVPFVEGSAAVEKETIGYFGNLKVVRDVGH